MLLDLRHLSHQTLGDAALQRVVLGLFLDEAPRYAADIEIAGNIKAWRMAVHTLKGVALNIGAFRLAQLCKQHEGLDFTSGRTATFEAVRVLTEMLNATTAEIRQVIQPSSRN